MQPILLQNNKMITLKSEIGANYKNYKVQEESYKTERSHQPTRVMNLNE